MPVSLKVSTQGVQELVARFDRIDPKKNPEWVRRALIESADEVQDIASLQEIRRGGSFRGPKGPRGGKGALQAAGALRDKLTSRTGTLRRSIRVNRGPLPWAIDVGTDLVYGIVHELGWSGTQTVRQHQRDVAFGRKVAKFTVPSHTRRVTFRPRPFLQPGLLKAARSFERIFIQQWQRENR